MSFFDDLPEAPAGLREPQPGRPEWSGPPSDELPGMVPSGGFVLRGPNAVVALKAVEVFSAGCILDLVWSVRRSEESDSGWREVMERGFERPGLPGILFGVALPDGRKAFAGDPSMVEGPLDTPGPVLVQQEGGGSSASSEQAQGAAQYWLWPLPAEGDLQIVAKWDDAGLPEGSLLVPAGPLARARDEVRKYWSE
ncbi:hypothetical protein [Paenarthrobacter nicotinovorans]|uniref:hypothetical protein n=1 Tax=Paenarthrobacter nicotinovorans TaxID=29320 RepID=UPI00119D7352|nr:hypothetical protein [Paenarthrobacter nicotinovorans]